MSLIDETLGQLSVLRDRCKRVIEAVRSWIGFITQQAENPNADRTQCAAQRSALKEAYLAAVKAGAQGRVLEAVREVAPSIALVWNSARNESHFNIVLQIGAQANDVVEELLERLYPPTSTADSSRPRRFKLARAKRQAIWKAAERASPDHDDLSHAESQFEVEFAKAQGLLGDRKRLLAIHEMLRDGVTPPESRPVIATSGSSVQPFLNLEVDEGNSKVTRNNTTVRFQDGSAEWATFLTAFHAGEVGASSREWQTKYPEEASWDSRAKTKARVTDKLVELNVEFEAGARLRLIEIRRTDND